MTRSPFDTIAAVSTPFGKGGVALIRLSGEEALAVAERVFFPLKPQGLRDAPARTALYGLIRDPDTQEVLDDGLCTVFPAPHSFTGEDTVELSCHGGVLVTRNVLEACLRAGAKQAMAGEFTRRAFVHGKLGLERAEALGNLLEADNDEQVRLARAGMNGLLTRAAEEVYSDLMGIHSHLEASIDFPEEDLSELSVEEMYEALSRAREALLELVRTYRTGHAIAEGIPTVICGRPNVGKSAFYNRLVGREAAIVTDVAGTTRDVLTDTVSVGRVTLRLSDTAGLRETSDPVERIGVERARQAMEQAELVLALSDAQIPDSETEAWVRTVAQGGKVVVRVYTKEDIHPGRSIPSDGIPTVCLSSVTGEGFRELIATLEEVFIDGHLRMGEEAVVFSARQAAALRESAAHLQVAMEDLKAGLPLDICADDLRAAMGELGSLCGRELGEEVISEIFSRFCVGK